MDQVNQATSIDWAGLVNTVTSLMGSSTVGIILKIFGGLLFLFIAWNIKRWIHKFKVWQAKETTDEANAKQDEEISTGNDNANDEVQSGQDNTDEWAKKERERLGGGGSS